MENKLLLALETWLLNLEGAQVKSRPSGGPGGRGELGGSEKCTGPGIGLPPPSPGLSLLHFLLGIGGGPGHHSRGQQAARGGPVVQAGSTGWSCGPGWPRGLSCSRARNTCGLGQGALACRQPLAGSTRAQGLKLRCGQRVWLGPGAGGERTAREEAGSRQASDVLSPEF